MPSSASVGSLRLQDPLEVAERDSKVVTWVVDVRPEDCRHGFSSRPSVDDKVAEEIANPLPVEVGMIKRCTVAPKLQRTENADPQAVRWNRWHLGEQLARADGHGPSSGPRHRRQRGVEMGLD
jgi:hypothetical protein